MNMGFSQRSSNWPLRNHLYLAGLTFDNTLLCTTSFIHSVYNVVDKKVIKIAIF